MPRGRFALFAAIVTLGASSLGCSSTSTCSRDEDTIDVYGYVSSDRTFFTSLYPPTGDPSQQLTWFPTNRTIDFHIGLVADPLIIQPTLSFSPLYDTSVANSAGSMAVIRKRTKSDIVVHNDTCSEFWIWLTATTSAGPFEQVTDGGVDPGAAGTAGAADTGPEAGAAGTAGSN